MMSISNVIINRNTIKVNQCHKFSLAVVDFCKYASFGFCVFYILLFTTNIIIY